MTFPGRAMVQGTFTVPTTLPASINVNCGFIPSKVELINRTEIGDNSANENWERVCWNTDFGSTNNYVEWHTASATTMNVSNVTSLGITAYNGAGASPNEVLLGTGVNGTSFTKATGNLVVSSTSTFFAGQTILITSRGTGTATLAANDYQLGGMFATVQSITNSTNMLIIPSGNATKWSNNSSFVGGSETFSVFPVVNPALYYPFAAQIALISQASSAVITTTTNTFLTVGQQVRITGMKSFGMTQINNLIGTVTVAPTTTNPNQVTVNINSTNFSAFAWPVATAATTGQAAFTPATLVPIGSGPIATTFQPVITYNVDTLEDATQSQAFQGFTVGPNLLLTATGSVIGVQASDVISWTAWRQDA